MATSTYIELGGTSATGRFKAAAKRVFASMIAAREREARRHVALHLSMLDKRTLARYGWDHTIVSALEKRNSHY